MAASTSLHPGTARARAPDARTRPSGASVSTANLHHGHFFELEQDERGPQGRRRAPASCGSEEGRASLLLGNELVRGKVAQGSVINLNSMGRVARANLLANGACSPTNRDAEETLASLFLDPGSRLRTAEQRPSASSGESPSRRKNRQTNGS